MYLKSASNNTKMPLVDLLIFLLIVLGELPHIYVFSNMTALSTVINFLQIPAYLGLIFVIFRRKCPVKRLMGYAVVLLILLFGYLQSGQAAYFRGGVLMLAVQGYPYKRILKTSRYAISSVFVLSIVLWILGISDIGESRRDGIALGYVHPNIAAQVILIIALLWVVEKGEEIKVRDFIIIEVVSVAVYLVTGTRTVIIILAVTPIVFEVTKRLLGERKGRKISTFLLEFSQIIMLAFTYITAEILPYSSILKLLDLVLSNRLFLNYYLFKKFPFTLFGQNVTLAELNVYNNIQDVWGASVTCDSTYTMSLILMGLIPTAIFCIGYILIIKKALRESNYIIIAASLLLAVYGFCESQMVEIYNNFVYFYILASYGDTKLGDRRRIANDTQNNPLLLVRWKSAPRFGRKMY